MPRIPLDTGPARGVFQTRDPYDGNRALFYEAWNHFVPDPQGTSGMYARRGFAAHFKSNALPGKGQGVYCYRTIDGELHNLIVSGGRLYRLDNTLTNRTDITPTRTQFQLWFINGTGTEPGPGDILEGDTSTATAEILELVITSGSFIDGSAAGYYLLDTPTATFEAGEGLEVSSTPVGTADGPSADATIQIDPDAPRVYFCGGIDGLILSDESNRPWKVTDITTTPVTGVPIDLDGQGTPWVCKGRPTTYQGSLLMITKSVNGVSTQGSFVWSRAGQFEVGYIQPSYNFSWTLEQTSGAPLYALWGTEVGVFYFRDQSIGLLSGTPGPDFATTATSDAIGEHIGCTQSATIQQWGNTIFFVDARGRPYQMSIGGVPQPLWLQLREVADRESSFPTVTEIIAVSALEPVRQLYLVAPWSAAPAVDGAPTVMYAFDVKTGTYVGTWNVSSGAELQAMGLLNDKFGDGTLTILGTAPPVDRIISVLGTEDGAAISTEDGRLLGLFDPTIPRSGVMWTLNAEESIGVPLLTEDGLVLLTEDDEPIITESSQVSWKDDGDVPNLTIVTDRLGYSEDHAINVDTMTIIGQSDNQQSVSLQTATQATTYEASAVPLPSADGTYRFLYGAHRMSGRGVTVIVTPVTAERQHILDRIVVKVTGQKAGRWDP